jgi:tetratricopeptide (TPR) repeat protein
MKYCQLTSSRYLYELGDYEISSRILSTATSACDDKTSLIYAELRNTAGAAYFELNLLSDCRMAWEECIAIRTKQLPHDDPGSKSPRFNTKLPSLTVLVASIYHNLGNLALAQGKTEEAIERLNRATQIWLDGGEATASQLALTYLCVGRVRMLQGSLSVALELTERSGDLFIRTTGREKGFMAKYCSYKHTRGGIC